VTGIGVSAARAALLPTIAFGIALVAAPGRRELAVHLFLLAVLAIALLAALVAIGVAVPSRASAFDRTFRHLAPSGGEAPAALLKVQREVTMARETAFDVHYRLRSLLRPIAGGLLLARFGIDLDRSPERARETVGAEAWELLRPDRSPPADRAAPGITVDQLDRVVSELEELRWS